MISGSIDTWACDFETNNYEEDCRVWSWGAYDIYADEYRCGKTIHEWIKWVFESNKTIYFHNLKFDGSFIIDWCLKNGFAVTTEKKMPKMSLRTMISDMGQWYKIELQGRKNRVIIKDSFKILSSSLENLAKSLHLDIQKGGIDYERYREVGYEPTEEEKRYQYEDCYILAKSLRPVLDKGMTKLTAGSNALSYYKKQQFGGEKKFRELFPELSKEEDEWIRKAYRGGVSMVKMGCEGKEYNEGVVYDINSMYPWAMHSPNEYPVGRPKWGIGEPPTDKLWIAKVWILATVKEGHPPTIQLKKSRYDVGIEYAQEIPGEELFLTNLDFELIKENYNIEDILWYEFCEFEKKSGLFDSYIDEFYELKAKSKKEKNYSETIRSKLYLNSLYGKFATRIKGRSKIPKLGENGCVKYEAGDLEDREGVYLPVGVFVTAYARRKLFCAITENYNRFLYCDTDSIHLEGYEHPPGLEVDSYKLGAFKEEMKFDKAKYIRAKLYMERDRETGEVVVTGAGMGKEPKKQVTFENFRIGATYGGNLKAKIVPGGTVLIRSDFKIRG